MLMVLNPFGVDVSLVLICKFIIWGFRVEFHAADGIATTLQSLRMWCMQEHQQTEEVLFPF